MKQSTYLRKVLNAAIKSGWWIVGVDDGEAMEKFPNTMPLSGRVGPTMKAVMAVEDATVYLENGTDDAFIRVIFQGPDETYEEFEEVICDHSMILESIISTVGE